MSAVVSLDFCLYPVPKDIKNNIMDGMPIKGPSADQLTVEIRIHLVQ